MVKPGAKSSKSQCPAGHKLPNVTASGQCTPLYCSLETEVSRKVVSQRGQQFVDARIEKVRARTLEQLGPKIEEAAELAAESVPQEVREAVPTIGGPAEEVLLKTAQAAHLAELNSLGASSGRMVARKHFSTVPKGLVGADAEAWADQKLVSLLPWAVAEVEHQLKFGTNQERERAAQKVLDATGRGKRDASTGSTAPIIVLTAGPNGLELPWEGGRTAKVIEAPKKELPE